MSKVIRKNRDIKIPKPQPARRSRQFVYIVIIIVLAAIPFSLGKYFEFGQPDPFDGGAYAYSAQHILSGAKIGVEEKPSALLGTLLVNMLGVWIFGFNETGAEIIQTIMQVGALALMFIAMRKLFGTLAAGVGVIVASIYLSSPLIAKYGNVKEQYMIACMIMGISCYVLYRLGGRWWYALLAGAFVSWAPLFKQTGVSAIGALGLFVLLQPILKNRTWRQTGIDILLLFTGVVVAVGPLFVWLIGWHIQISLPYSFIWETLGEMLLAGGGGEQTKAAGGYVGVGRKLVPFSEQWPRVLRYYAALILPIALAIGSITLRIAKMIFHKVGKSLTREKTVNESRVTSHGTRYEPFILLLAMWWLLDMGFVWISPRSYEQYYLPLNASAAMSGGYIIAVYNSKLNTQNSKLLWVVAGVGGNVNAHYVLAYIFWDKDQPALWHHLSQSYYRQATEAKRLRTEI